MSGLAFEWWTITKKWIKYLAQVHNAVPVDRFEPVTPRSRDWTTALLTVHCQKCKHTKIEVFYSYCRWGWGLFFIVDCHCYTSTPTPRKNKIGNKYRDIMEITIIISAWYMNMRLKCFQQNMLPTFGPESWAYGRLSQLSFTPDEWLWYSCNTQWQNSIRDILLFVHKITLICIHNQNGT